MSTLTQTANIPPQMFRSRTTWLRCRRVDENPARVRSGETYKERSCLQRQL
ncbi:hypothetical protein [Brevibacterium sp. UBA7493]|uniref:hypothetical protein n=1 Tax=Brevibacterium sp. UBA7493 TaxID=1946121 RepID=UPI00257F7514|nr:hypothetical protein [Brevibacterium sp. UBA7493]